MVIPCVRLRLYLDLARRTSQTPAIQSKTMTPTTEIFSLQAFGDFAEDVHVSFV